MSSVETVSALERRLNASIPQQDIQGEVAIRLKNIGRNAKIPGFRPGKVPVKVLEQYYGLQARQEVLSAAMQRAFIEAAQTNNLKVAGSPQFEIKTKDLSSDQIEYSATFEVYPEVKLGDIGGETVERATFELSSADVENTLTTLRKQRATYAKADRAAQNDDQVRIDFSGKIGGASFEGGEAKDMEVVLGAGRMLPDFEASIIGMKAGETKSFDMTFPEDYHGKDVAGKQVTFTVTLNSVGAPSLPELDAEFAKSMGVADGDVSKLSEEVRSNLSREVKRRLMTRNKDAVMDLLFKLAEFDVPKSLIESESQVLMQQTVQDMESRGMNLKGMPLFPELFNERAEKRVKLGLILADLVLKHGLKALPEQVRAFVEDYAQSFDDPAEVVSWYYADSSRLQEVENLVLEENVSEWVMQHAKTSDKTISFSELMGN